MKIIFTQCSVDRSQGGGSMYDGSMEIMLHRRILHDDSMGVREALNETAYDKGLVVSGKHILLFDRPLDSARLHRIGAQQMFMNPLATYSLPNTSSYKNYSDIFRQSWSVLSDAMPLNVHLLTFDQLASKRYLVRVEHYFELNEDESYSKPATIDLQTLFKSIGTINEMTELILAANLPLSELHRLEWITKDHESSYIDMFRELHLHRHMFRIVVCLYLINFFRATLVEHDDNHTQFNADSNISNHHRLDTNKFNITGRHEENGSIYLFLTHSCC